MKDLNRQIQNRYRAFLRAVGGRFTREEQDSIRRALAILNECCVNEISLTGEAVVIHSLEVVRTAVAELGLGAVSVAGALLAACSGSISLADDEIKKRFGENVYAVYKGLRKIEDAGTKTGAYQAENFVKLLLGLAEDIRVILIKLADRLEYLRKIDGAEEKIRTQLASESYFLYVPLAHRLGLYNLKSEMEDITMRLLDPDDYNSISEKIRQTTSSRNRLIREFTGPVKERLDKAGLKYTIKSRVKSVHSIWQKMKKQGVDFEEVYDLFAIRIILDSEADKEKYDCWQVYSHITDIYQPNPSRLRDWISVPKSNGYESLHTTVVGPRGKWVEVQIRTLRMDEIAEKGLAAHSAYKGIRSENTALDNWLDEMRELIEKPVASGESEILKSVSSGLYTDEVFIFTPKGDLKRLKKGATLLDFAFSIHSEVGAACIGGKVNGKSVSIRHVLKNGDRVDVNTSRNQKPKQDWLSFCVTSKARSRIKNALDEEMVRAAAEGKDILQRRLKNWKIDFNDALVADLIKHFDFNNARELYFQIYKEKLDLLHIKDVILDSRRDDDQTTPGIIAPGDTAEPGPGLDDKASVSYSEFLIIEDKVEGLDYRLAQCCNPVPGDKIFGFVTINEGVKIHRRNCPNAHYMLKNYPYRVLDARWTKSDGAAAFSTVLRVTGMDDYGMITALHDIIAESSVTMRNFSYETKEGLFEVMIELFVPNVKIINGLIKRIQGLQGVVKAVRFNK